MFSDKQNIQQKIVLIEDEELISNDIEIAERINDFFINTVTNLNIQDHFIGNDSFNDIKTNVEIAIEKFKNHPSILKIKECYELQDIFSFNDTSVSDIELNTN